MGKCYFFLLLFSISIKGFGQQDIFAVARKGTVETLKSMLKESPSLISSVNDEGYSLLVLATYNGNNEVAKFLIEQGVDVNAGSNHGSALMAAVVKGNEVLVKLLLMHGAKTDISDLSGNTALIFSTIFKKYAIAEMLVKAKADSNQKDIRGNSAMDYAKMANDEKLIQLFKTEKL